MPSYTPIVPGIDDPTLFPQLLGQFFTNSRAPLWSTGKATAANGRERRRQLWSYPKWIFTINHEVLRDNSATPDLARLLAFFNLHAGGFGEFNFYDPSDNLVTAAGFGLGDGTTATFQLFKTGGAGSVNFSEPVLAVLGTPIFMVNGTAATATVGSYGQVTFSTPPAAGALLTWSGQYLYRVTFQDDTLTATGLMQTLWSQSGLKLQSVKR